MLNLMHNSINDWELTTTVTIEDSLYEKALEVADPGMDRAEVFREAMKTFVRIEAAKRLAALGGSMPDMPTFPVEIPSQMRNDGSGGYICLGGSFPAS